LLDARLSGEAAFVNIARGAVGPRARLTFLDDTVHELSKPANTRLTHKD